MIRALSWRGPCHVCQQRWATFYFDLCRQARLSTKVNAAGCSRGHRSPFVITCLNYTKRRDPSFLLRTNIFFFFFYDSKNKDWIPINSLLKFYFASFIYLEIFCQLITSANVNPSVIHAILLFLQVEIKIVTLYNTTRNVQRNFIYALLVKLFDLGSTVSLEQEWCKSALEI